MRREKKEIIKKNNKNPLHISEFYMCEYSTDDSYHGYTIENRRIIFHGCDIKAEKILYEMSQVISCECFRRYMKITEFFKSYRGIHEERIEPEAEFYASGINETYYFFLKLYKDFKKKQKEQRKTKGDILSTIDFMAKSLWRIEDPKSSILEKRFQMMCQFISKNEIAKIWNTNKHKKENIFREFNFYRYDEKTKRYKKWGPSEGIVDYPYLSSHALEHRLHGNVYESGLYDRSPHTSHKNIIYEIDPIRFLKAYKALGNTSSIKEGASGKYYFVFDLKLAKQTKACNRAEALVCDKEYVLHIAKIRRGKDGKWKAFHILPLDWRDVQKQKKKRNKEKKKSKKRQQKLWKYSERNR